MPSRSITPTRSADRRLVGPLFWKTLLDHRKSLFWWSLGTVLFLLFALAFYPSIKDQPGLDTLYQSKALKAFVGDNDITSPAGYLTRELFTIVGPVLFIIFGITLGTEAIAGEESKKTLSLLVANPISRFRVIYDKFAAIKVMLLTLAVVTFLTVVIVDPIFQLTGINNGKVAVGVLLMFLLGLAFGAIGFAIGAVTGNRGVAAGVAGALAFAMYLLNTIQQIVDSLHPYRWLSLFYYANSDHAVTQYPQWWFIVVLAGVSLAGFIVSWAVFRRRDVHV